jgi:predicted TIM-barrel fold metal-dependent hydrolase
MKQIIDPHLHFFELCQGHYQWLREENAPLWPDKFKLRHNFHEDSLTLNQDTELAGFVHIEAGFDNEQPWREIAWLESSCTLPFKTVASIDLTLAQDAFIDQIKQLLIYPSVVGCRHILDDHAGELLSQKKVQDNLAHLADKQLSFELQMPLSHQTAVSLLINILTELPSLRVIINHAGWPPLNTHAPAQNANSAWQEWQKSLTALSQFKLCAIKCSGWEMAKRDYQTQWQHKIIKQCLNAFGDKRVMLASNFPLVLLTQDYHSLWDHYLRLNNPLNAVLSLNGEQITALTCTNAAFWYKFDD